MRVKIKDVLNRLGPFFILYLLVLAACFAIDLMYSCKVIFFAVNNLNSPLADHIEPYFTDIGDGIFALTLAAIIALINYRKALLLASSYLVTSVIAQVLKFIINKPRPRAYFNAQWSHVHTIKGLYIFSTHSFPSGHTVTAFSLAIVITYLSRNKNWGILTLLVAMLVGYSRMYLTQHFFEDVIAGSVIGVIATIFWVGWLDNRKFIHTTKWNLGLLKH